MDHPQFTDEELVALWAFAWKLFHSDRPPTTLAAKSAFQKLEDWERFH